MTHVDDVKSDRSSERELADIVNRSTDSFGKIVADNTVTKADIGSHYPHSPERHRLFINGTRFNLQYNSTTKFEDLADSYLLKPAAGDTIRYESAERFRYPVGYIVSISAALQANKTVSQLQGDDKIVLGYGRPDLENSMASADGWFWEWDSTINDNEVIISEYRDGTEVDSKTVRLEKTLDIWKRLDNHLNWYNVGNSERIETLTENGDQFNEIVGGTSVDNGKGPLTGNKHVTFNVRADAATSDLELDCGSIGVQTLGNATPILRTKASPLKNLSHTGSGDWEPLAAVRVDPDQRIVQVDITSIDLNEVSSDVDAEILAIVVDPDNTDATGFSTPPEHSNANSAVQETTNITTFPDLDGNVVSSAANPGGYQVGYASRYTQAQGTANIRRSSTERVRKRKIPNGDYAVILGKTGSAVDFTITYDTEQDW